jgi:hypothetical protein
MNWSSHHEPSGHSNSGGHGVDARPSRPLGHVWRRGSRRHDGHDASCGIAT